MGTEGLERGTEQPQVYIYISQICFRSQVTTNASRLDIFFSFSKSYARRVFTHLLARYAGEFSKSAEDYITMCYVVCIKSKCYW